VLPFPGAQIPLIQETEVHDVHDLMDNPHNAVATHFDFPPKSRVAHVAVAGYSDFFTSCPIYLHRNVHSDYTPRDHLIHTVTKYSTTTRLYGLGDLRWFQGLLCTLLL